VKGTAFETNPPGFLTLTIEVPGFAGNATTPIIDVEEM
jgi:hypothetical protein